ncbi:MAG: TIGR04282 family arsenosugar biosynthesis glycosyltransferase [Phycisphaerae bacterium]
MPDGPNVVIVFAKYPEPGRVKTRLIGPLTADQAADVHRRSLSLTLETVCDVPNAEVVLAVSPDGASFDELVRRTLRIEPQGDGDLGTRLSRVIEAEFARGAGRVIVVGSDCPQMSRTDVSRAFDLLSRDDVVLGPALDGGYYLLGLRRWHPSLFEAIDWSSQQVLNQTRRRAADAGLRVGCLAERRDVDDFDDIMALATEIGATEEALGEFGSFLRTLVSEKPGEA